MGWAKFDDKYLTNRKIMQAGLEARALHQASIIYCAGELTDGLIPSGVIFKLCALADVVNVESSVERLVDLNLYEKTDAGYLIVDWQDKWGVVANPSTQDLRHTREYEKFKLVVLERDAYTCVECGDNSIEVHVHHIRPFATYPQGRTDPNNAKTLCVACHEAAHERRLR